jgi:hypothetical protein
MDEMNEVEQLNERYDYHATIIIGVRKDNMYDIHSTMIKKDTLKELIKVAAAVAEGVLKDD